MKKTTKLAAGLLLSTVVAGSLYAGQCGMNGYDGYKDRGCDKSFFKKGDKRGSGMPMMRMMKELDLSYTQKKQIKEIMQKQRDSKKNFGAFFKDGEFDKAGFVKAMEYRKDNRIQNIADMMEKVYAVLDAEQKKEFVAMVEDRFDSKGRGMRF